MIIRGYGIELIRLKEDDIELVREKRNSPEIQSAMEFRDHITSEMQKEWFHTIDNIHNHYYVIVSKGVKCGLINGSKIDWEKGLTMSGGIFIWNESALDEFTAVSASILLTRTSTLMGLHSTYAKILKTNTLAINYNKSLGYELLPGEEENFNQSYILTQSNFEKRTKRIRSFLDKIHGGTIEILADDPEHPVTKFLLERIQKASPEVLKDYKVFDPNNGSIQ
jgi:UDP-4-amino-4,6-dideoxy-N-acetyl-beta-L-altrosamine N-acetyltransferase